eukprot:CAMPEP_0184699326 /NCGR_PEP_ID=MMETSP0313-20130426/5637_1 /TAXON_ID=2792 /ORGANISM="Porphyridium aerugineum, Strain SAG 1380-2" /LENGTH=168 /DNA_ID=CAMNT_0027158399 /DNA_START=51 /DNA_END=557 /DNA_ORIENTATION=-
MKHFHPLFIPTCGSLGISQVSASSVRCSIPRRLNIRSSRKVWVLCSEETPANASLTSKQRAALRSIAGAWEQTKQLVNMKISVARAYEDTVVKMLMDTLASRELVKVKFDAEKRKEVIQLADEMAEKLGIHVVQVIGHCAVFYKPKAEKSLVQNYLNAAELGKNESKK